MREIKFRAWEKHKKKMFAVTKLSWDRNKLLIWDWGNGDWGYWAVDEYELMQYIGLKDKNGKEIYEGDIVEFIDLYNPRTQIGKVYWADSPAQCLVKSYLRLHYRTLTIGDIRTETLRVLSNIYENPELLPERNERDE